jgi:hypothetical protein
MYAVRFHARAAMALACAIAGSAFACSSAGSAGAKAAADSSPEGGSGSADGASGSFGGGGAFDSPALEQVADAGDAGPRCATDGGPGTFSCTGSMSSARDVPGGARLPDGRVLIAGGYNAIAGVLKTAEIYDPAAGSFTTTGSMYSGHLWGEWGMPWPILPSGKVLAAGGLDGLGQLAVNAELYDPMLGTFVSTGNMAFGAISLYPQVQDDGSVLFIGGWDSVTPQTALELPGWSYTGSGTSRVERYLPATGIFQETGSLAESRLFGCDARLPNGDTLAIGGAVGPRATESNIERYHPAARAWTSIGVLTGAPFCGRSFVLPNGKLLLTGTGGLTGATTPIPGILLFDPAMLDVSPTMNAIPGWSPDMVQLASGDVLAFGGILGGVPTATAQVYSVDTNTWTAVGNLTEPRGGFAGAYVLASGDVLIVGGTDPRGAALASAEIFHPK